MRIRGSILFLMLVFALVGCATRHKTVHRNLQTVWREYLTIPNQRALAIAGDPRKNRWVTAASGGHATTAQAQDSALRECRVRRQLRRVKPQCVIYAIGSEIVWPRR